MYEGLQIFSNSGKAFTICRTMLHKHYHVCTIVIWPILLKLENLNLGVHVQLKPRRVLPTVSFYLQFRTWGGFAFKLTHSHVNTVRRALHMVLTLIFYYVHQCVHCHVNEMCQCSERRMYAFTCLSGSTTEIEHPQYVGPQLPNLRACGMKYHSVFGLKPTATRHRQ